MALDVLSIHISMAVFKYVFCTSGHVIDFFCTLLTPKVLEALLCAQDWLCTSHKLLAIEENLFRLEVFEEG